MWEVSQGLIEDAIKEAEIMLETGEKIRPIKFGDKMNSILSQQKHILYEVPILLNSEGNCFMWGGKNKEVKPSAGKKFNNPPSGYF